MSGQTAPVIPGLSFTGEFVTAPGGRGVAPVYETGFLDTEEGWRLFFECREAGDMTPYKQAAAAWKRQRASRLDEYSAANDSGEYIPLP